MTIGITFDQLLDWNIEASDFWRAHLVANPELLDLPCCIGGAASVGAFVAHIWGVELRWGQRLAGLPVIAKEDIPTGPLDAIFALHIMALGIYSDLLADPSQDWDAVMTINLDWLPPQARHPSRRKVMAHALFHSHRHWAQLATLLRAAGHPTEFKGDLLFSLAIR